MTVAAAMVVLLAGGTAPSLTGTWTWGSFEKGGGTLATIDDPAGTQFQLQLSRGAPTYNMGYLQGRLAVKDGRATFVQAEDGFRCEIAFTFTRESVVLKTLSADNGCPFGHQVHADGTYRRTSRKKPKFDLLPE